MHTSIQLLQSEQQAILGYQPTVQELYSLYTQGQLSLTNQQENELILSILPEDPSGIGLCEGCQ